MNEELKNALSVFIGLGESIEDKLDDGKLSMVETLQLVPKAYGLVGVFKKRDIILDQITHLTEEDREDLIIWFAEELDLDNDKTEELVELLFSALTSLLLVVPTLRQGK